MRRRLGAALLALALAAGAAVATAPKITVGPYAVGVERVARLRELEQPPGLQGRTCLVVFVEGRSPEAVERVVDLCRDPAAVDDGRTRLTFQQVSPAPARVPARNRRCAEVTFSGSGFGATRIATFDGTLVWYESKRPYNFELSTQSGDAVESLGVKLSLESVAPGRDTADKGYLLVKLLLRPARGEDSTAEEWQDERLALERADGTSVTPSSIAHQYQYDADKHLVGITLTGYFDPDLDPRTISRLRYTVTRLIGLRALPYRFQNLPLP